MTEENEEWGVRLKQARVAAGLSQKNLGIEAGIDQFVASTRINRYELGVHKPDLLTAKNLAKALGVPVAFFYADEDEIADLIYRYSKAEPSVQQKIQALLSDTPGPLPV